MQLIRRLELLYGVARQGGATLDERVQILIASANVRHFARVPELRVENWLADA